MARSNTAPGPAAVRAGPSDDAGQAFLRRFANPEPGSIRIGLELMVLDRVTCNLRPAADDILSLLDGQHKAWTATLELTTSMLEIVTSALGGYRDAADQMEDIRRSVRWTACLVEAAVAGGGAHPAWTWSGRHMHTCDSSRAPFAGFGMQVRVGVPGADEAVRVAAWLSQRAPLFIALSASSPYWQGVDSGFCSARNNALGVFQASGIMPASLHSWHDVANHIARLARRGVANGIQDVDWDVRPAPEHGAVELRALDTPLHTSYAAALACYARELCIEAAEQCGVWPCRNARELYQQNRFNATRKGVLGDWIDPCTRKKHTIEHMVRSDLARLAARSTDPDFPHACVLVHELLHNGGQARWLTAHTAAGARPHDLARLAGEMFERPLASGWKVES